MGLHTLRDQDVKGLQGAGLQQPKGLANFTMLLSLDSNIFGQGK